MSVIIQSSELPELLRLADRCLVLAGGRLQGELSGPSLNQEAIIGLAAGLAAEIDPADSAAHETG